MLNQQTIDLLNEKYEKYNNIQFIQNDPISIPHRFSLKQDIEISAFFAATFAWGQRPTIINKSSELMRRMDNSPYDFVLNSSDLELKKILGFVHRTFNDTDALYFISFLKHHYSQYNTLENAFLMAKEEEFAIKSSIMAFKEYFFDLEYSPKRTQKHISSPKKNAACKRINMFLRWMVRKDKNKVDFGIWTNIKPKDLIIPCDVHVERTARYLGLTTRPNADWAMAVEITENLKLIDPTDPCKFDYALFSLGVDKYFDFS